MKSKGFFFLTDEPSIRGDEDAYPVVDLLLTRDEVCLVVEVPGISRRNLEVKVEKGYVEIQGSRCEPSVFKKATHFYKLESFYGSFRRRIAIPVKVEPDKAVLKLSDGLLNIHIPRRRRRVVEIPVE